MTVDIEREGESARAPESDFARCRARLRGALARLAAKGSATSILESACGDLVAACGFTRTMISAVRGSRWVPLSVDARDDLDPTAADFRRYVADRHEIALANLLAETEMVRRRSAVLVDESLVGTRAFRPIVEASQSRAYVAAPIVVEGAAVGFVHADRIGQPRSVDDDDLRYVRAFSNGLAVAYQNAVWSERIDERNRRALIELEHTAGALRELASHPPDLTAGPPGAPGPHPPDTDDARTGWATLTARELDVLGHLAEGATNKVIAQRMSLSENTVKGHVHNVLRKLRVTTRAAAVAHFLATGPGPG